MREREKEQERVRREKNWEENKKKGKFELRTQSAPTASHIVFHWKLRSNLFLFLLILDRYCIKYGIQMSFKLQNYTKFQYTTGADGLCFYFILMPRASSLFLYNVAGIFFLSFFVKFWIG